MWTGVDGFWIEVSSDQRRGIHFSWLLGLPRIVELETTGKLRFHAYRSWV